MSEFRRNLLKIGGGRNVNLPRWFEEHIVCWYSPKQQGATNEGMTANPVLRDLSGNGLDLKCSNFAWNENSGITSDGGLCFDGVDDYGVANYLPRMSDFSLIFKRTYMTFGGGSFIDADSTKSSTALFMSGLTTGNEEMVSKGTLNHTTKHAIANKLDTAVFLPTRYFDSDIDVPITAGEYEISNNTTALVVGKNRINTSMFAPKTTLYAMALFNRTLTENEINYVNNNIIE